MGAFDKQLAPVVLVCSLGTVSTTGVYPLAHIPKRFRLTAAKFLDQAGITADNTNYVVLKIKKGSTELGALDTRAAGEGAVTANTAKAFTMAAADQEVVAASDITLDYAEGGTGTTTGAQVVLIGYWA